MGTNTISLPIRFSRYELSKLVNEALGLENPIPFDFIVDGKLLRVSLSEYMSEHGISSETVVNLEYVPIISRPEEKSSSDLPDWVSGIASDGTVYVAGCYDGTVHVYDMNDQLLCEKTIHKKPIKAVACKNSMIATASLDNTVQVNQIQNKSILHVATLTGHDSHVLDCQFSSDAHYLVSSAWNGSILIWDTSKFSDVTEVEPVHTLSETMQGVSAVAWKDLNVITGGWDHHIRIWDLESEGMLTDLVESEEFQ